MISTGEDGARRPIASRSSFWAIAIARYLGRAGVTPNSISVASILFAGLGAALMTAVAHPLAWLGAAVCIQLRLVCNLIDGMVAIEGGKKTKTGAIYNEFPDRIADSLLLVAAGYAAGLAWLGWLCALLAALTAYVRVFGGSVGLTQDFSGVMAKQRRMALLTAGLVVQAVVSAFASNHWPLIAACAIVALGSLLTCITRTIAIARALERT